MEQLCQKSFLKTEYLKWTYGHSGIELLRFLTVIEIDNYNMTTLMKRAICYERTDVRTSLNYIVASLLKKSRTYL